MRIRIAFYVQGGGLRASVGDGSKIPGRIVVRQKKVTKCERADKKNFYHETNSPIMILSHYHKYL